MVDGVEEVVIYELNGRGTHAARQLEDGRWASKLGKYVDIEHLVAESLEGPEYGTVAVFMERPRTS